jgi:polysaccharide pyruvyl transferase WcaK-like protein
MTDLRIGLLGAFGIGNTGNDTTLDAFADSLRSGPTGSGTTFTPVAVCPAPGQVSRAGLRAVGWTAPRTSRSLAARAGGRAADLAWTWRVVAGLDAVVLAGGGLLEVTRLRAATTAWTIAAFTWVARLQRKPVVFWGVGADEIHDLPARVLVRTSFHRATAVTVRDHHSAHAVEVLGEPAPREVVDTVLAVPAPAHKLDRGHEGPTVVGVGVFNARGATAADGSPLDADRYEGTLVDVVCELLQGGDDVILLGGAAIDSEVIEDISATCRSRVGDRTSHLRRGRFHDYVTARDTLAAVDLALVSRYHSAVAALTTITPTVSVGYGAKHRDLMREFGQEQYFADLSSASAEAILRLVERLRRRTALETTPIEEASARLRARARGEFADLATLLATRASAPGIPA